MGFNPCKPTSAGHLIIKSTDPFVGAELHPNYLDTEHDRALMVAGTRLLRRIADTAALRADIKTAVSAAQ